MSLASVLSLSACIVVAFCLAPWLRSAWVIAEPDEWLLCIRNGKVVGAGIGISIWRRPGDIVARFSSTVQRVRFSVDARTAEHLALRVEGFILWSVSPDAEGAFRAFSKLGIVNLNHAQGRSAAPKSRAHLLTSAQHHAFQALLAAEVRAHVSSRSLGELLTEPNTLVQGLSERFASLSSALGIRIERTEILEVQPVDPKLLKDLSARSEEGIREEAEGARLEAAERLGAQKAAANARQASLDLSARLAAVEGDRQVVLREGESAVERQLAAEAGALQVLEARHEREEGELELALDRVRRTAEVERDAALARGAAEERKSQAVRDLELAKLIAERATAAMESWQIRDAKWVSLGDTSPATSIASMIGAVRELVGKGP